MRLIALLIVCLIIISCTQDHDSVPNPPPPAEDSLGTGWSKVADFPNSTTLDIFFVGNVGYLINGDGVYRSTDAGETWQRVHSSPGGYQNIGMGSSNNAYFIGGFFKKILVTNDGGNSFDSVIVDDAHLTDVFAINANIAYAVGYHTWKTINAGQTWTKISSFGDLGPNEFSTVHFENENLGWVNGELIQKTTNGGVTWDTIMNGLDPNFQTGGSIFFSDQNTGFIASYSQMAKTTNGGANWTMSSLALTLNFHDIHFINTQKGYVTDGQTIYKTINGGQSWVKDVSLVNGSIIEIHFNDAGNGWACGSAGIFKYVP